MRKIFFSVLILIISYSSLAQKTTNPLLTKDVKAQQKWVDSIYNSLTLTEKVGQLYMVQVMSNQDEATKQKIINTIKEHQMEVLIDKQN